jgi:ABC-type sugar transport system ATPase subunit
VLDHVDLTVENGEIHALLGANGAGKSTLIKCVSGAITPDEGEIDISGRVFTSLNPRQAQEEGVAVIYQELSVVNTLNVTDNLFLGSERTRMGLTRRSQQRREAQQWLKDLGIDLDPKTLLSNMSAAELQVVEIAKALRREPEILILDEPTAALSEKEVVRLGKQMQELKARGLPLLFITHRLSEVFEWADRVTVLHGGRVVLTSRVSDASQRDVVAAITQKESDEDASRACQQSDLGEGVALRVRGLVGPGIGPVDLDVQQCEVVGVYGLVGSGRTELAEALFGAWPMESGTVEVNGFPVKMRNPEDAIAAGIALVPSDRLRKSLFLELAAYENVLFPSFGRLAHGHFWRDRVGERKSFQRGAEQVNLQPPTPKLEARRFSGGNQQKLILSRLLQMGEGCRVMLLDEPTQGVDVGARSELYRAVREFAQEGRGVLVTSCEPGELMLLADRVIVLSRGRVVGMLQHDQITENAMVHLAHFGEATDEGEQETEDRREERVHV